MACRYAVRIYLPQISIVTEINASISGEESKWKVEHSEIELFYACWIPGTKRILSESRMMKRIFLSCLLCLSLVSSSSATIGPVLHCCVGGRTHATDLSDPSFSTELFRDHAGQADIRLEGLACDCRVTGGN